MAFTSISFLRFTSPALVLRPPLRRAGCIKIRADTDPGPLRRPLVSSKQGTESVSPLAAVAVVDDEVESEVSKGKSKGEAEHQQQQQQQQQQQEEEEEWLDWEDVILQETVPLVGFVRIVLHSGQYKSGDRLSTEHQNIIMERLLAYHPDCEKKIGTGIDFITIGYHPDFENSRCLFIVRNDGELVDFSFWKCIKGLIRQKYPLYADTFILRHFRRTKNYFANLQND